MKSDILIVDDTPANLTLLSEILRESGYKVRAVPNGKLALSASKSIPPDLILLDITMPKMNGYEVCTKLKADKILKDIPILFISALSETSDKIKAFKNGGVDYITKPFQREEVLARVETHLKITSLLKLQKKHLTQIQSDYQKLKDLEDFRDGLIHMIIHDMRTPLFGISANIELFKKKVQNKLSSNYLEFIDSSYRATQILTGMINDLLDINKFENENIQLNKEKCKIIELVNEAVDPLKPLIKKSDLNLIINSSNISVNCDKPLLIRVISNLISNAIKYTPQGKKVEIVAKNKKEYLEVQVIDKGSGIPEEFKDIIFNKFSRLNNEQQLKIPSTGLGLTFCKIVIESHGGSIGVKPSSTKGSCFWFTIPAN